jgi:hypothetical protein
VIVCLITPSNVENAVICVDSTDASHDDGKCGMEAVAHTLSDSMTSTNLSVSSWQRELQKIITHFDDGHGGCFSVPSTCPLERNVFIA